MRRRARWIGAALSFALLTACGDDEATVDGSTSLDGGTSDATTDAWALLAPAPPAMPAPPAPPAIAPCPAGWVETSEADLTWCEPWLEDVSASCAIGEAQRPGEAGCVAIGSACPAGEWPADLPAGATVLYVRAGATGGDGTPARPFGTIAQALAIAPEGATIALAAGTYEETVSIDRDGIVLRGACPTRTRVTHPGTAIAVVSIIGRTGVVVRDLTLGPFWEAALAVGASTAEVRGVVIDRAGATAIVQYGGRLSLADVAIEDPRPDATGQYGRALMAAEGGEMIVERSSIRGAKDVAVVAYGAGARMRIVDSAVVDTIGDTRDRSFGRALVAMMGAALEVQRSTIRRQREQAVYALGTGTTVRVDQSSIFDTRRELSSGLVGFGAGAHGGASIEVVRTLIDASEGGGLASDGTGSTIVAEDVVIRDTGTEGIAFAIGASGGAAEARRIGVLRALSGFGAGRGGTVMIEDATTVTAGSERGAGIVLAEGGTMTADRITFVDTLANAVFVNPGGQAVLRDVTVRRVTSGPTTTGRAIEVWNGRLEVHRGWIEDAEEAGIVASDAASLVVEDTTVTGTRTTPAGTIGRGLSVQIGATAQLDRVVLEGNHDIGLFAASDGTIVEARDLVVRGTQPIADGTFGRGISVQHGASVAIERGAIEQCREVALFALGERTAVTLRDLRVEGTAARACAPSGCDPGGVGVGAYDLATLRAERFVVAGSALCGIQLAVAAQIDLAHGVVRDNAIGACVQVPGYDLARLMDDVQYVDNESALDTEDLPIPEPAL